MLKRQDVINLLKAEWPYLKEHFGVAKIAIFGSYARDEATENSDIDLYIEFDRTMGIEFIRLLDYLESQFHKRIDVLTAGGIAGIRHNHIAEEIKRSLVYV